MNKAEAFNTLVQGFKTWVETNHPTLAPWVQYPDIDKQPPESPQPWIRWSMQWSGSIIIGAGQQEERHTGMAFVELFYPVDGWKDVNLMAQEIETYYRAFAADGGKLQCKGMNDGARPWTSTPPREAGWIRRTVNVPVRLMESL